MICPSCQAENIQGADECNNCGAALYGLDLMDDAGKQDVPKFVDEPISSLGLSMPGRVGDQDPVSLAIRHMQQQASSCVLVMAGDEISGILTSTDILDKVAGPTADLNAVTCGQVMTANPTCLNDDDSIALALNIMARGDFRHIPVLSRGAAAGVIEVADVFRHISPNLV